MSTRISKNLKYLRENRERSKSWISQQIGKRDSTIGDYERGKVLPPLPVLEQYAELFSIYIGDLVGKDLWLGEGSSMVAEEPGQAYGIKYQKRVEDLLHGKVDDLEGQRDLLRKELSALKRDLGAVPADSPIYGRIQRMIELLES